jgi:16S rRNA (cytosine1407-C5)-methyltransferase
MAAVMALDVRPGHDVLDLCAAPGGKTSLIRRQQQGRGMLVANELSRARTVRMKKVLARLNIEGVEVLTGPGASMGSTHERCFDRVLADVPCSGEGRFHLSDAATWSRWSLAGIRGLAKRQATLLESACKTLRPGGVAVYATCTMAPEENERVVDRVVRRGRIPLEILPVDLQLTSTKPGLHRWQGRSMLPEMARTVRVLGDTETTPFYIARLRRTG